MTKVRIEENDLLILLRSKDPKGLVILYDNYSAALFGIVKRIVNDDKVSEDVLQDSFVKIWKNLDRYDESKGRLFTWMVNICRNTAIDKVRSAEFIQQTKNRSPSDFVHYNEASTETNTDSVDLKNIISNLEPEYQQVITLLYFGGYSQSEAAKQLNIPIGTVKTRSRAAIQKLRAFYNSNGY